MGETTKGLFYGCLAIVGILITIIVFFLYAFVSYAKRQFVYNISVTESTSHQNVHEHIILQEPTRSEQEASVENHGTGDADVDDKDTDSLTRNLSFTKFERPERFTPDRFTPDPEHEGESVENVMTAEQTEDLEKTENLDQPVVTEGHKDDDQDSDSHMSRGLSFTGFENLIHEASTREIVYTDDQETTGELGNEGTSSKVEDVDSTTGSKGASGELETINENDTGFLNILNTESSTDDDTGGYSLNQGILSDNNQQDGEPAPTGYDEISESLKNQNNSGIIKHGKSNNNNGDISSISSSSPTRREEKQVSFSGNNSTYIVESRGKTVQMIQFDETSNFEFVKFVRKQQKT